MSLTSDQDLSIASVNGTTRIVAKQELTLECGGAFIQLKDGNITLGGPFDLFFKVITIQKKGAAELHTELPELPRPVATRCALRASQSGVPFARMTV
jgi:type VI secretion system secreted protein VgrG